MKIGDFVRVKNRYGILETIYRNNTCSVLWHNGIKPTGVLANISELIPITEKQFLEKNKGKTALFSRANDIKSRIK